MGKLSAEGREGEGAGHATEDAPGTAARAKAALAMAFAPPLLTALAPVVTPDADSGDCRDFLRRAEPAGLDLERVADDAAAALFASVEWAGRAADFALEPAVLAADLAAAGDSAELFFAVFGLTALDAAAAGLARLNCLAMGHLWVRWDGRQV